MKCYNIYNKIGITLHSSRRSYARFFDDEYKRISLASKLPSKSPSIEVHILDNLPEQKNNDIMSKIRVKKLMTFQYTVRDIEEQVSHIYFKQHPADRIYIKAVAVFVQTQLLEPLMYYKLLKQNILFMHAAGVANESAGFLFPAHGGTGKTTLSLRLVSKGFKLLGDDLLLVDTNTQKVSAYARPFHLFTYNIDSLEGVSVPLKLRIVIRFKNLLRSIMEFITRETFMISTRVHADELYEQEIFAGTLPYKKIVFLKKHGTHETITIQNQNDINKITADIIRSADLNDSLYKNIITEKSAATKTEELEKSVVSKLISQFKEVRYINTRKLPAEELDGFIVDLLK